MDKRRNEKLAEQLEEILQNLYGRVQGELEMDLTDKGWVARDYREPEGAAFEIDGFEEPIVTIKEIESGFDPRPIFDRHELYIVG